MIFELEKYFHSRNGFVPTNDQLKFLQVFSKFMHSKKERCCLVLNGYAGTGKTTLIGTLVDFLKIHKVKTQLAAPTGRAAKVMTLYSGKQANTIHKLIYFRKEKGDGSSGVTLKVNRFKDTLFIVDEASMIGSKSAGSDDFGSPNSLLEDLMEFVYNGDNCRLLLSGDVAQLPPVNEEESAALNVEALKSWFYLTVAGASLKEVVRQKEESGILYYATDVRMRYFAKADHAGFTEDFPDVRRITGVEVKDEIDDWYAKAGQKNVAVINFSNKQTIQYNSHIRNTLLGMEDAFCVGDQVMVVRNNYFWLEENTEQTFIANGDVAEVNRIFGIEEKYGFQFADVSLYFPDFDLEIEAKLNLSCLYSPTPAVEYQPYSEMYNTIKQELRMTGKSLKNLKTNPYIQALQVKFSYAITGHKSQGGQWPIVFVDFGFVSPERINNEFFRWLYTAITRATERLFLVNFPGVLHLQSKSNNPW